MPEPTDDLTPESGHSPEAGRHPEAVRHPEAGRARAGNRRLRSLQRAQQRLSRNPDPAGGPAAESSTGPTDGSRVGPAAAVTTSRHGRTRTRLWRSLVHPGRGQIVAAALLFLLGMAGVMQIRINTADDTYTTARREDLIQLLDGLGSGQRRLESEIADQEQTRTSLQSGADTQRVAREEAVKRADELSILAGTAPAQGPGIRMRIADPAGKVGPNVLLDAVEEMRDAGAEVIEVNNTVRVVGSTWFGADSRGLLVDGQPVSRPLTIEVIGDPHSLEEAARFRGGIVSEITGPKIGGQVQIDQETRLVVESLHITGGHQYAQPASSPPTPR